MKVLIIPEDQTKDGFIAKPVVEAIVACGPGGGRKKAMQALRGRLTSLLTLCGELADLRQKMAAIQENSH